MTIKEFNELKKKHFIYDNVEEVFDFVSTLLYKIARELEEKEPYATNTINRLDNASYEVWSLIEYVSELENEQYSKELEGK